MDTSDRRSEIFQVSSVVAPDGGLVLQLAGELDLSTVPMFVDAIDDALDTEAPRIEIDMGNLTFLDSSGVGAYVGAFRKARAQGTRLAVGDRSSVVDRVLQLSGVEEALAQEAAGNP